MSQIDAHQWRIFYAICCTTALIMGLIIALYRMAGKVQNLERRTQENEKRIGQIYEEIDGMKFKKP